MRSKLIGALAILTFASLTSSCGIIKVDEGPLPEAVAKLGGSDLGCLKNSKVTVQNYVEGRGTVSAVNELARCATRALQIFGELTRGEERGMYKPTELRTFLQRYFLGDIAVSNSLLAEVMLLKQSVMGGRETELSLKDLDRSIEMIEVLRTQAVKLIRHMPINTERLAASSPAYIDEVTGALHSVAEAVGKMFQETGVPYSFGNFRTVLDEVGTLFPQANSSDIIASNLKLAGTLKALLLSTSSDEIAPYDWPLIFCEAAKYYGLFLQYRLLETQHQSWTLGAGRMQLMLVVYRLRDLLANAINRHGGEITFEELEDLIGQLELKQLPISKETLMTSMRPVVRRSLGGIDRPDYDNLGLNGVTVELLDRVLGSFYQWSEGQRYLEGVFSILDRNRTVSDARGYTPEELRTVSIEAALTENGVVTAVGKDMATDLRKVISENRPLFRGNGKEITFPSANAERERSLHNLSEINWMRQAARLLIAGYAWSDPKDKSRSRGRNYTGITLEELQIFAKDIWDIAMDVKLVNPKNDRDTEAKKRFLEANLFVPGANGDDYVNLDEGSQLLGFLISAKRLAVRMHSLAARQCQVDEKLDYFDQYRIEPDCYRRVLFGRVPGKANYEAVWYFMPGMAEFYSKLPNNQLYDFQYYLEEAARREGYGRDRYIESADSEGFALIFHYIESVYSRYDRDFSGTLNYKESKMAFPQFRKTLTEISGFDKCRKDSPKTVESKVEALFTYLLAHGQPPVIPTTRGLPLLVGGAKFWAWRQQKVFGGWHFNSNRMTILQVFGQIGKMTAPVSDAPSPSGHPPMTPPDLPPENCD
jgi:hypothetical protein